MAGAERSGEGRAIVDSAGAGLAAAGGDDRAGAPGGGGLRDSGTDGPVIGSCIGEGSSAGRGV
jgi:hypothetical protein